MCINACPQTQEWIGSFVNPYNVLSIWCVNLLHTTLKSLVSQCCGEDSSCHVVVWVAPGCKSALFLPSPPVRSNCTFSELSQFRSPYTSQTPCTQGREPRAVATATLSFVFALKCIP